MKKFVCLALVLGIPMIAAAQVEDFLYFRRGGTEVAKISREQLATRCGRQEVTVADPYYETEKKFSATSLRCVLELGFGSAPRTWGDSEIIFKALDGYARSATAETLARDGGFLALGDADRAVWPEVSWAPIGREKTDPGPFYRISCRSSK